MTKRSNTTANKNDDQSSTGQILLKYLNDHDISMQKLAELSDVSVNTVYRVCSGNRIGSVDTWIRFASALGCTVDELLGRKDGREE